MSHWIMGVISALFGLIGLFMAARARDFGIELFGLVLFAAAVLFWVPPLQFYGLLALPLAMMQLCHTAGMYLVFFCRPGQHAADLIEQVLTYAACFHDVRLLAQVLGDKLTCIVQCARTIFVQRTDNQLRTVDLFDSPARSLGSDSKVLHCFAIVCG